MTLFREIVPFDEEEEDANNHQFHQMSLEDPRLSMSHYGGDTANSMLLSNLNPNSSNNNHNNSNILLPPPTTMKRTFSGYQPELNHAYHQGGMVAGAPNALSIVPPPIGIDPNYIPQRRRRIASKYVKERLYQLIYLSTLKEQSN